MITLRRAKGRHCERQARREIWVSFSPKHAADPFAHGFGPLLRFDEGFLPSGASLPLPPHSNADLVTFVYEGALVYDDAEGFSDVIHTGEVQRTTAGHGVHHRALSAGRRRVHLIQLSIQRDRDGPPASSEQKRFSAAERRGLLCVVASPDARRGSLRIYQDARVYSSLLDLGQHIVHPLAEGRGAWLHVVSGALSLDDLVLTAGDAAAIKVRRSVSFTARAQSEVLLIDLSPITMPRPK